MAARAGEDQDLLVEPLMLISFHDAALTRTGDSIQRWVVIRSATSGDWRPLPDAGKRPAAQLGGEGKRHLLSVVECILFALQTGREIGKIGIGELINQIVRLKVNLCLFRDHLATSQLTKKPATPFEAAGELRHGGMRV